MKSILFILMYLFISVNICYAGFVGNVNKGNKLLQEEKYDEALQKYRDAQIDNPESTLLHFNMGDALYKKGEYEEAMKEYEKSTYSQDIILQSQSYYNMGNTLYKMNKLDEALSYYKKCLDLNSEDEDAKYNVEFVQRKIKEMMDKQQSSSSSGDEKEKDEKEKQGEEKEQSQKEQKQADEKEKKQESNKEQQPAEKEKEKGEKEKEKKQGAREDEQQKKEEMSKQDAERLLEALSNQDKLPQEQRQQVPGIIPKAEDW